MSVVILFRDPNNKKCVGGKKDEYREILLKEHTAVESVPVLEHASLIGSDDLESVLEQHKNRPFDGIILTSKNAVCALSKAAQSLGSSDSAGVVPDSDNELDELAVGKRWEEFLRLPIFVVGRATSMACRRLLFNGCDDVCDIRGEDTGSATSVTPVITSFCQSLGRPGRLVYFCGDKRRNTLPDAIRKAGNELVEVMSYMTACRSEISIHRDLHEKVHSAAYALCRYSKDNCPASRQIQQEDSSINNRCDTVASESDKQKDLTDNKPKLLTFWLVFFSPSGVSAVKPIVPRNLLDMQHHGGVLKTLCPAATTRVRAGSKNVNVVYRVASIGETTMTELVSQGFAKDAIAVAPTPSAKGIFEAIHNFVPKNDNDAEKCL